MILVKFPLFLEKIANAIDTFSEWSGRLVSWLVFALVMLICYDVVMRYFFQSGSTALQELEWHIFSLIFLLGAAYTLKHDGHVRVDVFYQKFSERGRAWVDLLGTVFLLIPFCVLIIYCSWPFVHNAYEMAEASPDPGGLPYRFLLKAAIPLCCALLALQGLALAIRNLRKLCDEKTQSGAEASSC